MTKPARGRRADSARLALLCLAMTPLTILLHELGHFAVALYWEMPAELHATRVVGGARPGSGAPAWLIALQAGAGPLVTLAMSLAGAFRFGRTGSLLALAFAFAAASRLVVTAAWLAVRLALLALDRPMRARPVFDEYQLAGALGIAPELTAVAATAFLAGLLYWLMRRTERRRRLLYLAAMTLAAIAGNILWPAFAPSPLWPGPPAPVVDL